MKNNLILLLGSNIEPARNLKRALSLLKQSANVISQSRIWETEAVGSDGPNFLNRAVEIETSMDADQFKSQVINPTEKILKRVRTADKNAPRTIDLDIIIFNQKVLDSNLWECAFIALPVSEIRPELKHPLSKRSLKEIVEKKKSSIFIELFDDQSL